MRKIYGIAIISLLFLGGCEQTTGGPESDAAVGGVDDESSAVAAPGTVTGQGLGGVNAPTPGCGMGESYVGMCERADITVACKNDDGDVVGSIECEQVTCSCSGPNSGPRVVRGIAACPRQCRGGSTADVPPPISVTP